MTLRLPADKREEFLALAGARAFEPMPGRVMKEYVVVPGAMLADRATLSRWAKGALEYGSAMPAKPSATERRRPRAAS